VPRTAQVFLGLFVLWQLFFLFSANLLSLVNEVRTDQNEDDTNKVLPRDWKAVINRLLPGWLDQNGHVHDGLEVLKGVTERWQEFTGQPQHWQLFAPTITRDITFVAVELRWDEEPHSAPAVARRLAPLMAQGGLGRLALAAAARPPHLAHPPELLLSENEPANPRQYFRWGKFRLRKYESDLDLVLRVWDDETLAEAADRWRDRIKERVRKYWDNMLAYLRMRCRDFLAEHPGRPMPTQVILKVRRYRIPTPKHFSVGWYRLDPNDLERTQPIARWQPGVDLGKDYLPVETYVPQVGKDKLVPGYFEAVARGGMVT
jgi:hypothetical protein